MSHIFARFSRIGHFAHHEWGLSSQRPPSAIYKGVPSSTQGSHVHAVKSVPMPTNDTWLLLCDLADIGKFIFITKY